MAVHLYADYVYPVSHSDKTVYKRQILVMDFENVLYSILAVEVPHLGKKFNNILCEIFNTIRINLKERFFICNCEGHISACCA